MQTVGDRIREKRIILKISQPELAERVGVSKTTISFWESDKTNPNGKNLMRLAFVLKTTPRYILTGDESATELDAGNTHDSRAATLFEVTRDLDDEDFDLVVKLLLSLSRKSRPAKT